MQAQSNRHKVPTKQWKKWSTEARFIFNNVFEGMADQPLYLHTKALPMKAEHWKVSRWNAAWLAASLHDEVRGHGAVAHAGGH
jgi:hypothetical protein